MSQVQFKVNLPLDVKTWLEVEAKKNIRSQGAQIVACLRAAMSENATRSPVGGRDDK